jgi:2-oxoglutarate dehydrogenase E2 component (dihydrolipoamide succinyltransferase)
MATQVKVPSVGESITSGIIATWHVKDGDYVETDQLIYELETDKVTSEATAPASGVIKIIAAEGDEVEIGQVVAELDESASAPAKSQSKEPAKEAPKTEAPVAPEKTEQKAASQPVPTKVEAAPAVAQESESTSHDTFPPSVVRLAAESGIDPATVKGTGKGGRVTKEDMELAIQNKGSAPKVAPKPSITPTSAAPSSGGKKETIVTDRYTKKPMTPLRKKIAERLVSSQQNAAILTTFNEVDMSKIMQLRKTHQDQFIKAHDCKLGFMSFFVKAVVNALKAVPQLNAQIEGDCIVQNNFYDIGVAVGTAKGLVVPVIRDCDKLSFAGIEKEIIQYAKKARDGKITIDDMQGGVFTITNGGIYGSMMSTPIINPPQSGILGMHSITDRAVVVNGEIVIRPMMYLAVSYDHRLVDGKEAVTFLVNVKNAIEDPSRLLFEL